MATALFVCRQNAGRSQMSAVLFEQAAEGRHRALSAGTTPADRVHPEVVDVMRELGVELSDRVPRPLTRELAEQADVVVTMGCGDECPYIPGKRYVDWELEDPAGRPVREVRAIRDDIGRRVRELAAELDAGGASGPALSVQLYSVRDAAAADLPETLARLAETGWRHVEPFDLTADPRALHEALTANGLRAPSAHASLSDGADLDRVFDAAATVGAQTVIHPFSPPEQWSSKDGVSAIAQDVVRAQAGAARHGLRVGYHNHHWEMATMPDDRTALEHFADEVGPEVVLELDTYWAAVGGQDVPALLGRLGDQVRMLHLKDGPIDKDAATQLPVGSGALPVPEILRAAPAAELAVLEFDDYAGDVFEGLATGYRYVTGLARR
jgi:protein-tyrosine-phosphatase/sugar phosphate isomerase/epimerase